jgi:hypothetical protein
MKFKMAVTAGLSLTLDPMGKMFQNASSLLRWRPSWISDRHKKQKLGNGHSNDLSFTVWVQVSSLVSEKKIFEISANQSILLALAAILNIRVGTILLKIRKMF